MAVSRSRARASKAEDAASETSVLSWGGTIGLWEGRQATLRARWHDKRQADETRRGVLRLLGLLGVFARPPAKHTSRMAPSFLRARLARCFWIAPNASLLRCLPSDQSGSAGRRLGRRLLQLQSVRDRQAKLLVLVLVLQFLRLALALPLTALQLQPLIVRPRANHMAHGYRLR